MKIPRKVILLLTFISTLLSMTASVSPDICNSFYQNKINIEYLEEIGHASNNGLFHNYGRKMFYTLDRWWIFYSEGSNIVYTTISASLNQSETKVLREGAFGCFFYLWGTNNLVHYVYNDESSNSHIYYGKGVLTENGTIDLLSEQIAVNGTGTRLYPCGVCIDINGYPYVVYGDFNDRILRLTKSSFSNDTWSTDEDFPKILASGTDSCLWSGSIVPFRKNLYVAYSRCHTGDYDYAYGNIIYLNGSLGEKEQISEHLVYGGANFHITYDKQNAHLVYTSTENEIYYRKRDKNGWGVEELVSIEEKPVWLNILANHKYTIILWSRYSYGGHNEIVMSQKTMFTWNIINVWSFDFRLKREALQSVIHKTYIGVCFQSETKDNWSHPYDEVFFGITTSRICNHNNVSGGIGSENYVR